MATGEFGGMSSSIPILFHRVLWNHFPPATPGGGTECPVRCCNLDMNNPTQLHLDSSV